MRFVPCLHGLGVLLWLSVSLGLCAQENTHEMMMAG